MELRLEGKTLAIGILLGVVITMALGVNGTRDRATGRLVDPSAFAATADKTDYGLSVNNEGMALVRLANGDFFVVNPKTGMAVRVLRTRRLADDPFDKRNDRGIPFNYSVAGPAEEEGGGYGK